MGRWLIRRLGQALITLLIALILIFLLIHLAPGDPLSRLQAERALSPQQIASLRALHRLDQPLPVQFWTFLSGLARGDLGTSIDYGRPVRSLLAERLPATVLLGVAVLLLNFSVGVWLGVRQAVRRGSVEDHGLTLFSLTAYATPAFWLGLVLAWLFGVKLRLLPPGGFSNPLLDPSAGLWARSVDILRHLVLPAVTLSVITIAGTMRYQRNAMLDVLRLPYIVTARAKGLSETVVTWRHAWRTALSPVITVFGLWLPLLVTGSVFVESVFAWPGLGSLATGAVSSRDYPLIMGVAVLVASLVILANLLTDLAQAALDPRVRLA